MTGNRSRIDYLERFQRLIDEYNAGSVNVDLFFERLIAFAQELSEEDRRAIAEELTEEQLAVFDLLTKPDPTLTKRQEQAVKKVALELLATLKAEKLVLDWRKRQQTRAAVQLCIQDMLDQLPSVYTLEIYERKCDLVYQHIYESYFGEGQGVYASVA